MTPNSSRSIISNPFATPDSQRSNLTPPFHAMSLQRSLSPPPISPLTPASQRNATSTTKNKPKEPEEEITFNLMVVASAVYTIPLKLARQVSPVWSFAIERDAVDDGDGLGLNLRCLDVEADPFCYLLYQIYSFLPGCQQQAENFNKDHFDRDKIGHGASMLLTLKTLVLARLFKISVREVHVRLLEELENGMATFVTRKQDSIEVHAMFERVLRKAIVDVRDVEKLMKEAINGKGPQ